jgi:DNA polymerase-4
MLTKVISDNAGRTSYRLLGVGLSGLVDGLEADPLNLAEPGAERQADAERALDRVRERFGTDAIGKGRGLPL